MIEYIKNPSSKDMRRYLRRMLENVIMTGIPQIVTEPKIKRKIFKLFIFFGALFGFFFQLTEFLLLYFTYPTNLEASIKFMDVKDLPKPIITVCDNNGVRRTTFCRDVPRSCEKTEFIKEVCENFDYFCKKENFTEEDLKFPYNFRQECNRSIIDEYGIREEDILPDLSVNNITFRTIQLDELLRHRNCYSIYPEVYMERKYDIYDMHNKDTKSIGSVQIKFNPEETTLPGNPISVVAAIHSKDVIVNPFISGITMTPGNRYIVQLTPATQTAKTTSIRKTIHFHSLAIVVWRNVKKKLSLKTCGCISAEYPFVSDEKVCYSWDDLQITLRGREAFQETIEEEVEKYKRELISLQKDLEYKEMFEYSVRERPFIKQLTLYDSVEHG
ncbi:uncharacterized protein LOC111641733 [Centruroides sculpturatus]|uniref:uncharacterized protein LOC111641733 n=1 Tax=Centruroides sculpturatus TaxID=218467 RepID=UPI000C6C911F|nr:uncharacterized protein LOC111641733 [Centruroides sculpturatus]